ncbi:MAG: hypothetical protein E7266_09835 [Lachnospiraceae bacterium]|nr:hypothetical protein [Lachnospiraceae bacterium]
MTSSLDGKKILILGGGISTYNIVVTAKNMGIYVICADYYETGVAKEIADESLNISTNDFEALAKVVKDKEIDGIFTGASEFNCKNMIRLAKMTGRPCYCNIEQWNLMQNKRNFKDVCRRYGVQVVPEYSEEIPPNEIVYPVIVKPTDSYSAQGMSICRDEEHFKESLDFAYKYSSSKTAIVERYMVCDSVAFYYTIQNGEISFSHMIDWYRYKNKDGVDAITATLIYPSKYTEKYMKKMDKPVRDMIKGIGLRDGYIQFQAFVENDEFYVFECGLRIPGSYDYPIIAKLNGINYLEMMIEYAVNGSINRYNGTLQNDPFLGGNWAANVAVMLKTGVITKVYGVENIMKQDFVLSMTTPPSIGHRIEEEHMGTLHQTFCRFNVIGKSKLELLKNIEFIFKTIKVTDEKGINMVCEPIDYSAI